MSTANMASTSESPVSDPSADAVLEVSGLQAGYGPKRVVYGIDFKVGPGEVVGIIGHNGAGKTTTLHTVFGTHKAEAGTVRYKGTDITGRGARRNVRDGMTMVRAERFTFGELTVKENLQLAALSVKSSAERDARLAKVYDLLPILKERSRQQASKFSGGQQRLLSIGMSLLADPQLIILDEPSLGIAPSLTARIFDTVKDLVRERGISVLIVEQNIPQLLRIVDRVYVIRGGRVILEESNEQMQARDQYWDLF
jgi:branched-chain amino acid transport system ATP-binding protein